MHKVGNFDIFKEYDFFEVNMFDVIITKNCIKPTEDIVKEMLKESMVKDNLNESIEGTSKLLLYIVNYLSTSHSTDVNLNQSFVID